MPGPFARVDHLVIAIRDLDAAARAYATMLGLEPAWRGTHPEYGTANVLFGLGNCYLELLAIGASPPAHPIALALAAFLERRAEGPFALALGSDDLAATVTRLEAAGLHPSPPADGEGRDANGTVRRWRSCLLLASETRGVSVIAIEHPARPPIPPSRPTAAPLTTVSGIDHVVMFSDDLDGALAFWRDRLGLPERWRREFAERGTINVGLRLADVTIELVAPLARGDTARGERLWGVAYTVTDCAGAVARLRANGLTAGDARPGLAPRTRVSTVKWQDGTPTLLLQHGV